MNKAISVLLFSVVLVLSPVNASAASLKILVVVSELAEGLYDGAARFATIKDTVGDQFEDAGLTRPSFVLSSSRPQLAEAGLSVDEALALVHLPAVSNERNSHAADLVLLVLLRTNEAASTTCGAAPGISTHVPNYVTDLASGKHAWQAQWKHGAFVTLLHDGCTFIPFDIQAAHEIGHLLYAEHEVVYDTDGNAVGEVKSNGDPDLPFKKNHPAVDYPNRTIMFSQGPRLTSVFYSKFGKEFSDGEPAYGSYEDVASVFGNTTYNYVAHYKEPEPLQSCNIRIEFYGCSNNSASNAVTATLPGFSVVNADYDLSYNNSSWFDLFEGILTCPSFSSSASLWARAILTTATGQISECTVRVPVGDCDDDIWIF